MKNIFKRLITCSIASCLIAATVFAGACKDNGGDGEGGEVHSDPTKNGYTITALYPDNTPVKGTDGPTSKYNVGIQLKDASGKEINGGYATLNEYGTARINYRQSGEFLIDVQNCPRGFEYIDKVTTVAGRGDYTIKLSAVSVSYTINVKRPDGTPAIGVGVALKQSGVTVKSATTNASGTAVISDIDASVYDVELTNLDGLTYLATQTSAKNFTLDIELISVKELKLDEKMSDEKLNEWDELANGLLVKRFDRTADCYDFTTDTIPEGKKIYYYFTADEEGEYRFISSGKYYTVEFYGSSLGSVQKTASSIHGSTNTCEMTKLQLKADEKCYFSYSIPPRAGTIADPDDHELTGTRNFMIAKPVATAKQYEITAPAEHEEYDISFDTDTSIITFKTPASATPDNPSPTDGGIFEIKSNTDIYDVKLEYYAYLTDNSSTPDDEADDISDTDKNFSYTLTVPPSYAGNSYYFKIIIKSRLDGAEIEYPAEVPITITRTGNAKDNFSPVVDQHATATEKYPEQQGTFRFLLGNNYSIKESDFNIVQRDGGYYVNIDGTEHELVVAITKNISRLPYSYATIEYMGGGSANPGGSGGGDELPSTPSQTKQNSYLTLYTDPAIREDKNNPKLNFAPFIEEYSDLCNGDGVYKLNDELKAFIEKYYIHHSEDFKFGLELSECCWLVSCGYYA